MSSLDLALIFFLSLTVLNYCAHRSVLYPPFIFCAMWLLDLVVVQLNMIELDPVHGNTLAIVAVGAASFSLGGLFAGLAPRTLLRIHLFPVQPRRIPDSLRSTLTIVLLCGLPVMFYQILQLSKSGGGGLNILMQARLEMIEAAQSGEPTGSFVLSYFTLIAVSASLLFATEKRDRQFWVVTAVAFLACILTTGRTNLLLLLSGLSAISLLQKNQQSLVGAMRLLRWPIAIFVALYIGLIFTNKNTGGIAGGAVGVVTYLVVGYIVGPLGAFDNVVQRPADFMLSSSHTFETPMRLAAALHLTEYTVPPAVDSFTSVPFPTNVYTVFKFYYLELGIAGCAAILFIVGLLHSLLYLKSRHRGRLSLYLFGFSVYSVVIVIFDDAYYGIGVYLRVIAFGLLYFLIGSVPFRWLPKIGNREFSSREGP